MVSEIFLIAHFFTYSSFSGDFKYLSFCWEQTAKQTKKSKEINKTQQSDEYVWNFECQNESEMKENSDLQNKVEQIAGASRTWKLGKQARKPGRGQLIMDGSPSSSSKRRKREAEEENCLEVSPS